MNNTGVGIALPEKNSAGLMHNIFLDKKVIKTKDIFNSVFKTLPFNAIQEGSKSGTKEKNTKA